MNQFARYASGAKRNPFGRAVGITFAILVLSGTVPACSSLDRSGSSPTAATGADAPTVALVVPPTPPSLADCTSPYAPVLEAVPTGAVLPVFANPADGLVVGVGVPGASPSDASAPATGVQLPDTDSTISVFAQVSPAACPSASEFSHQYSVVASFAPAAGSSASSALSKDDARFAAWASKIVAVNYGDAVTAEWQTPDNALGPASGSTTDVVSLGEGGTITVGFDVPLADGTGYDFAVFENGFGDDYLELAFVEVSSDGTHYVRFDTSSLVDAPVGAYGRLDPTKLEGFAGKYRVGFGTPFDLAWLEARPEVQAGLLDLSRITSIRVVDIIGDGRVRDSFGHVVYDPFPTTGSAGFDLEAIGLLNVAP
jgi:hypothetical protein